MRWKFANPLSCAVSVLLLSWIGAGSVNAAEISCQPRADLQQRLRELSSVWQLRLSSETGFAPPATLSVCQLVSGLPFADYRRQRIYVRGLASVDDEITLAHEYLHLAFGRHPRGRDEVFIEQMARSLVESP